VDEIVARCILLETAAKWAQADIVGPDNRRGAPAGADRRALEAVTAEALILAGVPLTKGREGRLAKALRIVYESTGSKTPEDMFPILDRLVQQSKNGGLIRAAL
jgi:hypothetical protein